MNDISNLQLLMSEGWHIPSQTLVQPTSLSIITLLFIISKLVYKILFLYFRKHIYHNHDNKFLIILIPLKILNSIEWIILKLDKWHSLLTIDKNIHIKDKDWNKLYFKKILMPVCHSLIWCLVHGDEIQFLFPYDLKSVF